MSASMELLSVLALSDDEEDDIDDDDDHQVNDKTVHALSSPTSITSPVTSSSSSLVQPFDLTPVDSAWHVLPASQKSLRTGNPIRAIVDPIAANIQSGVARGDGKDHISLALGDPTAFGHLPPCPVAISAVTAALQSPPHAAGYTNACGSLATRQAIAAYHSHEYTNTRPDQVIVANGCSGALELILTALLDPDSILLVPQPGFPLYQVIAESHGARVVPYRCIEPNDDNNNTNYWECDLRHIRQLLGLWGHRVRGLVLNNPGNPTGAVLTKPHLVHLLALCHEYHLPVVADEVYGDLTFDGHAFTPLAAVAAELGSFVPVVTASGIGKQFLLPGWRVGWIVFQDNIYGSLRAVEAGAKRLAQVLLGASHLAQTAVPALLRTTDEIISWKAQLRTTLAHQANVVVQQLQTCPGLHVRRPQGALYTMIRLDVSCFDTNVIRNDVDFCQALLREENVLVLPGACFQMPNVVRVVFCAPPLVLETACRRMREFCQRHARNNNVVNL